MPKSPTSLYDPSLIFMGDFAAACKAQGDMLNYYRWKMVRQETLRGYLHLPGHLVRCRT